MIGLSHIDKLFEDYCGFTHHSLTLISEMTAGYYLVPRIVFVLRISTATVLRWWQEFFVPYFSDSSSHSQIPGSESSFLLEIYNEQQGFSKF